MLSTYQYVVAALSVILSLGTVIVCVRQKCFYRYFFLNLYLLLITISTLAGQYLIHTVGYTSAQYFYFYFTSDAITNIICYLVIGAFFDQMFRQSFFARYVRPTLAFFFLLVILITGLYIARSTDHLFSRFVLEFQQNMYFVGVLLTFLLWMSMMYLGAETRRFALLVSGLGIYFTAHAASYAASFLSTSAQSFALQIPPVAYTLMTLVWLYTFLRVPEGEAAVEPARARGRPWAALPLPVRGKQNE